MDIPILTCHFFLYILKPQFFLVKLIGQYIPVGEGRGIARDVLKNYFHFQNSTKKRS